MSGGAITGQDSLESFTGLDADVAARSRSLLTSLLVFITLFFVFRHFGRRMASVLKRSGRYAVISMVPILLVVAWIYGFMYLVGYRINVITATIAAISIGVGVDYATHFTVRFIEEFEHEPSRFPALRRAGEGTGGALAISAATSMTGFLVMATAPMPMFATFGVLTAVMIAFSLLVSLLVLPSLLAADHSVPQGRGTRAADRRCHRRRVRIRAAQASDGGPGRSGPVTICTIGGGPDGDRASPHTSALRR